MMFPLASQNRAYSKLSLNEHLNTKIEDSNDFTSRRSPKSEQAVCRICLGTEEEGQQTPDRRDFDLVNGEP